MPSHINYTKELLEDFLLKLLNFDLTNKFLGNLMFQNLNLNQTSKFARSFLDFKSES